MKKIIEYVLIVCYIFDASYLEGNTEFMQLIELKIPDIKEKIKTLDIDGAIYDLNIFKYLVSKGVRYLEV